MNTRSRVRQASEISYVFEQPVAEYDDNESESEDEDFVESESAHESEEDADSDEGLEEEAAAAEPPLKKHRGRIPYLRSKSGFTWSQNPPEPRGRRSKVEHTATPKGDALNVTTPLEAWSVLFTEEIINIILIHTNEEIDRQVAKIKANGEHVESYHKFVDLVELKALLGLLYFAGMHKLNRTFTKNLYSPYGMSLFRLTMPERRFVFLLYSLRFDDKNTRAERKATDRLASIREIWDLFVANCMANYEPGTNCTIGEQLLSFRGRCLFRVYMPAKPDKYGLKIVSINDAVTHYMMTAIPYVGVIHDKDPTESIPSYYVRKLSEPIHHTGRNITCDNWFTSIPICETLKTRYGLTMIGTIRKNEREIPEKLKKVPPAGTNIQFAYHAGKTLVSYNPKAKKIVLLLSSLHVDGKIDDATGKPEIVVRYDKTKSGTECFDKKCRDYTTARRIRRWPMRFFYGILDQANVNSLILYTLLENNKIIKRTDFILDLSMALIKPLLARRLTISTLRTTLRLQIETLLEKKDIPEDEDSRNLLAENKMVKQKRCGFCPVAQDRKTYYKCLCCQLPMCRQHVAKVCCDCSLRMQNN